MTPSIRVSFFGGDSLAVETDSEALFWNPLFTPRILGWPRPCPLPQDRLLDKATLIALSGGDFFHCDLASFKYFKTSCPVRLPKGLAPFVSHHLANPVAEWSVEEPARIACFSTKPVAATPGWQRLRPLRRAASLNFDLEVEGKTLRFLFHPLSPDAGAHWSGEGEAIRALFPSFRLSPWKSIFSSGFRSGNFSHRLPIALDLLERAETVIPIGWAGFSQGMAAQQRAVEKWRDALFKHSPALATKIVCLNPGDSHVLS